MSATDNTAGTLARSVGGAFREGDGGVHLSFVFAAGALESVGGGCYYCGFCAREGRERRASVTNWICDILI